MSIYTMSPEELAEEQRRDSRADEAWFAVNDRFSLNPSLSDEAREAYTDALADFVYEWVDREDGEPNADDVYFAELDPAIAYGLEAAAEASKPGTLIGYWELSSWLELVTAGKGRTYSESIELRWERQF